MDDKCSGNNVRNSFWKTIEPFMTDKGCTFTNNIILKENEQIVSNQEQVGDIFNDYFATIAEGIGENDTINLTCPFDIILSNDQCFHKTATDAVMKHSNQPSISIIKDNLKNGGAFNFHEVSCEYVKRKLLSLDKKKSTGPDSIPPKLIKMAAEELSFNFCTIINMCIRKGIFPEDMKQADITPLFKKLDALCKDNYRQL